MARCVSQASSLQIFPEGAFCASCIIYANRSFPAKTDGGSPKGALHLFRLSMPINAVPIGQRIPFYRVPPARALRWRHWVSDSPPLD